MAKLYTSKKDPEVTGRIVKEEPKYGTVIMEYLTGENAGKTTNITAATLKRWWKVSGEVDDKDESADMSVEPESTEPKKEEAPELVTQVTPKKKSKKNPIDSIDRDSKVAYLQILAQQAGVTLEAKKTDPYELRVIKDDVRLGHICIKLRKFTTYTRRTLQFADATPFTIESTNDGMAKISSLPDDALLETVFNALLESEE